MRKAICIAMASMMALSLCACGGTSSSSSTGSTTETSAQGDLAALFDEGYTITSSSSEDNNIAIILADEEGNSSYIVTAVLTDDEYDAFIDIDFLSDDYDEQMAAFLEGLDGAELQSLESVIPTQEELDVYVGGTIGDMIADGFENTGYMTDDTECVIFMDNSVYECYVYITDEDAVSDPDTLSEDEFSALHIASVEYSGISMNYTGE